MSPPKGSPAGTSPGSIDPAFWRGRKVFLTGHTGFKGSWLSLWLESLGARVTGFALEPPTTPNLFTLAAVARGLTSITGDIRDFAALNAALRASEADVVLHMAAQSVVKKGYSDPVETYSSNVMGTVNLFEAIRRLGRPCAVVNVTTDKCYAHREGGPGYREDEPMGGDDPYSNSKGCAELVTHSFRLSYFPPAELGRHGVALASARAGNAIGGGDWTADQLIPDLVRGFLSGKPCLIRSPGGIRPWQFVVEPLRGYLMLAEALVRDGSRFASGWNFGPADDDAKPVSWIADRMVQQWGEAAKWQLDGAAHPAEAPVLRLDATKAASVLGWQPAVRLPDTLDWIVEWYQGWAAGKDPRQLTLEQLDRYQGRLASTGRPAA